MDTCKSPRCGKPIIFARTEKGHRIPLDPDPVTNGKGNLRLSKVPGDDLPLAVKVKPGEGTHVSHFVTCPASPAFRSPR